MQVKFKILDRLAVLPSYAKAGDAGLDLTAIDSGVMKVEETTGSTPRHAEYREYRTGLAVEIPNGYVGLVFPRSSISKTGLSLANAVGVIDSGYRGEIALRFKVLHDYPIRYNQGDKIGQLVIIPIPYIEAIGATELSETERGTDGFGSSGA